MWATPDGDPSIDGDLQRVCLSSETPRLFRCADTAALIATSLEQDSPGHEVGRRVVPGV
jgi:hypothetical protein